MNDLKKRLLPMEQLQMPDQWQDIEGRSPRLEPDRQTSGWRRAGVAAAALVIAVAAVTLAVAALSERGRNQPNSSPTIQPPVRTNGVIAYASIGEQGVFWTIRPDGSDRTKVDVDVPGFVGVPSWSPDGTRIAFAVNSFDDPHPPGGYYDIYTANADGTDPTRLTSEEIDHNPVWSPDGTRIAYVHGYSNDQQIWVMNADGSDPHQVTDRKGLNIFPSWSPDGSNIAFVSYEGSNADIYVMNADGTNVLRLTDDPAHEDQPAWSPEGERIAFTSEGGEDSGIYTMSPDGSGVIKLLDDPDPANLGIAWSPDGTRMAIVSIRGPGNDRNVYVLDIETGDLTTIGEPGAYFGTSWQPLPSDDASPSPSPDPENQNLVNPSSPLAVVGSRYPIKLFTHCGIDQAAVDFDESWWDLVPGSDKGKFSDPFTKGTMTLTPADIAIFRAPPQGLVSSASKARFLRHEGPIPQPGCY
ncbi:MAG TPA: hypothetical protein VGR41_03755 [Actinomycetota bacterium]|jgi:TolB protein|nr:hypothetical protein [Actinomycetota bacterium]